MPYIAQVAINKRPYVSIYGWDYSTKDGTGCRDYVHITDLARGHVGVLSKLKKITRDRTHRPLNSLSPVSPPGWTGFSHFDENIELKNSPKDTWNCITYNLGTGRGGTVLEMIKSMSKACGRDIPYKVSKSAIISINRVFL